MSSPVTTTKVEGVLKLLDQWCDAVSCMEEFLLDNAASFKAHKVEEWARKI